MACCLLAEMTQGQEVDTLEVRMLHRRCMKFLNRPVEEVIIRTYDEYWDLLYPYDSDITCPDGTLTPEDFEKYDLVNHGGIPSSGCGPHDISQIIVRWPAGLITNDVYYCNRGRCLALGATYDYWFLIEKLGPDDEINYTHHQDCKCFK